MSVRHSEERRFRWEVRRSGVEDQQQNGKVWKERDRHVLIFLFKRVFRSTVERFEVWKGNTLDRKKCERKFDSNPVTEKAKKRGNNKYRGRKEKKNHRGSVRKGAEGSRINDFIMPLRNI